MSVGWSAAPGSVRALPAIAVVGAAGDAAPSRDVGQRLPLYPLLAPGDPAQASPHVDQSGPSGSCAACHRSHTASAIALVDRPAPQSQLCFACHDGTGSSLDVAHPFSDPAIPADDPTAGAVYRHPATVISNHVSDRENEFAGVLERHAACADCHNPHAASGGLAVPTAAGWLASGALAGTSGVVVSNGSAGAQPGYEFVAGIALEYQLCLKCHSGFTVLPDGDPAHPSRWALDKGIELNPANGSYHPIEAAGTNATDAVAASLAGGALWQFGRADTIRCVNCHGDPSRAQPGDTTGAGERLAPHASTERGLLIAPYRDRLLKPAGEAYAAGDFALCYLCHAEAPFTDPSGATNAASNFEYHGSHVSGLADAGGAGTDIDVAGSGEGNAICAECHFRLHSTALAVNAGDRDNTRLVNFGPNVQPYNGLLEWSAGPSGSCTLTCHGAIHDQVPY